MRRLFLYDFFRIAHEDGGDLCAGYAVLREQFAARAEDQARTARPKKSVAHTRRVPAEHHNTVPIWVSVIVLIVF